MYTLDLMNDESPLWQTKWPWPHKFGLKSQAMIRYEIGCTKNETIIQHPYPISHVKQAKAFHAFFTDC